MRKHVTITLTPEVYGRVAEAADRDSRTVSFVIEYLCRTALHMPTKIARPVKKAKEPT